MLHTAFEEDSKFTDKPTDLSVFVDAKVKPEPLDFEVKTLLHLTLQKAKETNKLEMM